MAAKSKPARKSAVKKAPAPIGKTRAPVAGKPAAGQAKAVKSVKKPAARPAPAAAPALKARSPRAKAAKPISLGRPKVVGEELLDLVFKEDFHARQIFVFLGVRTVRELEAFRAEQIYDRAAQPIRETIERIRRRLALLNRSLEADQAFALKFQQSVAHEQS